ncbi:DUF2156 domain-containing protein [Clostridium estertheticum]|uniref:bifunctional lysylphosphatidylglycerol flippase/synthetase MprF n=1 Tax=Clostridium estertheticum TaxID=238834 RepID=UPI0013E992F0|nr:DUF2156 domain-containing protein [Clostridium estertheticum]MBZ9688313.1 DUF2156 domain-containing protein [Clostridium estertheticum]
MKRVITEAIRNIIINTAVFLTVMLGIENILYEYYYRIHVVSYISKYFYFFSPEILALHRTISVITGFVLIFTSCRLYKRMRMAWLISISMLSVSMLMHVLNFHSVFKPAIIVEFIVIIILAFNYKNFKRASDPISLRNSIFLDQPFVTAFDKEKVRKLLHKYGENSLSYNAIEDDKKYFFSYNVEGVIVYTAAAGVAVCAGDPICSDKDMPLLITEFITHCKQNDFDICFCHTLEKHIPLYTFLGFGKTKCGEEAMFDLETYNLAGGKAAKIRNAINHASALGVTISEYKPLEKREKLIEQQINDVSDEWLKNKNSSELSFMLGTISLDNPMDRRYFAAYDNEKEMLGFIVFSPFIGGNGYLADVTRRRNNAPIGVMEKITIEAFDKMKLEGVKWGTLGLAPLVNAAEEGGVAGKLFEFVYKKLNSFYGFKGLYHYKKKYGPTVWENRYIVYYPKLFTPKIAYSIIKAQNPKGVGDFLLVQLKLFWGLKKKRYK